MNRVAFEHDPAMIDRLLSSARENAAQLATLGDSGGSGLQTATMRDEPDFDGDASPFPGYQVVRKIHRGGQGIVYQAIRESTGEDVAIKVLHDRRAANPRELDRFAREAELLRELNHPNLIAVSEVGVTGGNAIGAGRPYLVMPYIPGWPLDEHVRRNGLSIRETLTLFAKICDAVNAAHLNGVIHRDIKPSNIRVDDAGEPHVLDFGLAKHDPSYQLSAISCQHGASAPAPSTDNRQLTTDSLSLTETGQFVGSLPWASPEQADPSLGRVDVRTDVYSLGAVLYQLLTGVLPIDPTGSQREVLNRIVTAEPVPLRRGVQSSALRSPTTPRRQSRTSHSPVDDDVETIVHKCLEKDRTRRYANAGDLADDIRHYLAGEPIEARRDSVAYMLRKQLRRYRWPVATAASIVALTLAGLAVSLALWRQTAHARDAEADQRARAEAINTFLKEMLTAADPANAKGAKLTVREALDTAAKRIQEGPVKDQPLVEAEIRFTIGSTYYTLSLYSEAEAQLRAADAIQSRELGDEHRATLRTRYKLAQALSGKSDWTSAIALARPTMEAQRRLFGPDDADTLESEVLLGSVVWGEVGRFSEAESLLRDAIERLERVRGPDHQNTAGALDLLGELYALNSYAEKAEPLLRRALRIRTQELGQEHPRTLDSMFLLGISLHNQARHEEAVTIYRRLVESRLRVLGPDHMGTLAARGNLAFSLCHLGRHSDAETMHRENLAALLRNAGPTHSNTITEKRYLAHCLHCQGKYSEEETLVREALDTARETFGVEDADTSIKLMCALTRVLATLGKDTEAEQVAQQAIEFLDRQLPRPNPALLDESSIPLIQVLKRRGAMDEALQVEQDLIESWLAEAHGPDASAQALNNAAHRMLYPENEQLRDEPRALELALQANQRSGQQNPHHLSTLAQACLMTGDSGRASEVWERAIALSPNDESRARLLNDAAGAYLRTGDLARAKETWMRASALLPDDPARAVLLNGAAWELLTITPESLRDSAAALVLALKANEFSRFEVPYQLDTLALAYHRTGETAKAIELQKKAISLLAADAPDRAEYEDRLREFQAAPENAVDKREK